MGVSAGTAAIIGTGVQMYGQHKVAQAQKNAADFNAQVAEQNEALATQKAAWQTQEGEQNVGASEMKTAAQVGGIKTFQAASGVDVNSGSAVDVENSARTIGKLDALTIRSNAARAAYGYQVEETSDKNQAILDRYAGKNAVEAGKIAEVGTALKFAGTAATQGGFGSAGGTSGSSSSSTLLSGQGNDAWSSYNTSNSMLS